MEVHEEILSHVPSFTKLKRSTLIELCVIQARLIAAFRYAMAEHLPQSKIDAIIDMAASLNHLEEYMDD